MNTELSKETSATDKERSLWIASEQYTLGRISAEKLEEIELPYAMDLKNAVLRIAEQKVKKQFRQIVFNLKKWLKQSIQNLIQHT